MSFPRSLVPTVAACLVVEIASKHGFSLPDPVPATLLIGTLVTVVYAAFQGGLASGAASAVILALYSLHFVSPEGVLVEWSTPNVLAGAAVFVIALGIAAGTSSLRSRENAIREGAFEAERRHHRELADRNRQLAAANDVLESFSFVVSHDLKEPVRAVGLHLAEAEDAYGEPEGLENVRRAARANERLRGLLQNLLELSRATQAAASREPTRIQDVLDDPACASQFESLAEERGALVDVDEDLPLVMANRPALCQVFGNLILNAIKHNPSARPQVRVRVARGEEREGKVAILVEDNGSGFAPEIVRMFDEARPRSIRRGFGLLIARRTIERLGGSMTIGNRDGAGGRVTIRLIEARPIGSPGAQRAIP